MDANPSENVTIKTNESRQTLESDERLAIIYLDTPYPFWPVMLTDVVGAAIRGWCKSKGMAVEVARMWVLHGEVDPYLCDAHYRSELDPVLDWLMARIQELNKARATAHANGLQAYESNILAEIAIYTNTREYVMSLIKRVE